MKKIYRIYAVILILTFLFAGCSKPTENVSTDNVTEVNESGEDTSTQGTTDTDETDIDTTKSDENTTDTQSDDIQTQNTTREIVDMAGRTVEIPSVINKVYATSQIGIIMLYTINPDKLAGWGFDLVDEEKVYIPQKYHDLPMLGVWSGKTGSANVEEIIKVHPDVIFSIGTIEDSQKSQAEKIQNKTGIPVVMLDEPLVGLDDVYELLGDYLGEQERCKELGDYCAKTVADIKAEVDKIPENERLKVYYAEGATGLETDPMGSFHTQVLDFVGGINVADVEVQKGYGRAKVSLEQLLVWNPDVIIAGNDKYTGEGAFSDVYTKSNWSDITAVKNQKVYLIPTYPYNWFDRPPSVNRIMGVKWLANLLYPEYVKLDIKTETKEFYKLFYNYELSDDEVNELLKDAGDM